MASGPRSFLLMIRSLCSLGQRLSFAEEDEMLSMSESQAFEQYAAYQNAVPANERVMTFLEWVRENKVLFRDVDPAEQQLLVRK